MMQMKLPTDKPKTSFQAVIALASVNLIFIGTLQAALWTPTETTTALWFDAADASTITETSGNVSQWADKSGNGRNATQATGAAQPDSGGTHNGLNTINFNGSSEFFRLGTGLDWMAANATHTAFVMLNATDNRTDIYGANNPSAADASLHIGFGGDTSYRMNRWGNDFGTGTTANFDSTAGAFNSLRFTWVEGGAKSVYANTLLEGMSGATHASGLSAMAGGGQLGKVVNHGYLGADIAEFIIVDGVPDAATTDQIEGYLAWKWGEQADLPGGHAYASAAPVAVPEPSSSALFGLAGLALILRRHR